MSRSFIIDKGKNKQLGWMILKNPTIILIVIASSLVTFLAGCHSKSEEEVIEEAKQIAEETFTSSQMIKPNQKLEHFTLYLPEHLEIEEVDVNNLIVSDGQQTYIIFYNNLEEPTSELNYQMAKNEVALLLADFQTTERFGYIQILAEEDDQYLIQVGVGGAKITTYTTKNQLANHAEELMRIALSIE